MNRRDFFKRLGLVAGGAAAVAVLPKVSLPKIPLPNKAIRHRVLSPEFRKLNRGITRSSQEICDILNEPNELFHGLEWRYGPQ